MFKKTLLALTIILALQSLNAANSNVAWIRKEKIKATYTWMSKWHHKNPEKVVKDIHKAGFNSIFLKGGKEQHKRWVAAAEKNNIKLFIAFNYWSKSWKLKNKYRNAVYQTGKACAAPCPINQDYWNKEILPRQLELAKQSKKHKCIAGLLLDTEMYGIKPHAFLEDVCFCENCFGKFMHKQKRTEKIEAAMRYKWLQEHKLLLKYYSHLESEFTKVITEFRIKLQKQNPQLVLGNLNFVNTWFFRAMLKGLGTKAVPAISAPESPTYRQGYIPFVDKQQVSFKREKIHVFYVPGIWNMCFYPESLARNSYKLAIHSDGYFDFTIRALYGLIPAFNPTLMKKSNNDLKNYWDAYKYANSEISKKVKNKSYQSPLNKAPKSIAIKVLRSFPAAFKGNPQMLIAPEGNKVSWLVSTEKDEATIIIELNEKTRVKRVKALCQGGGTPHGLYFPGELKVYYTSYDGPAADIVTKAKWISAATANEPDNRFTFAENGHHSLSAYRRYLTARMPIRSIDTKFVKLVFKKKSDSYAEKVTRINQKKVRRIMILKIEVI